MRRFARGIAVASLVGSLAGTAATAGEPPPCIAEAEFEARRVTVGQQVLYRVRIFSREDVGAVDWVEPPTFPGFRAERLPGKPSLDAVERDRVRYDVREEHRALFPERAGELRVKPARLRCSVGSGDGKRAFAAPIPAASLSVVAPPREGRPPGFEGLIGPIVVQSRVAPREVRLGESVRVTLALRGDGNLWDVSDPLAGSAAVADAEVFPQRPEIRFESGVRLFSEHRFRYDVVPRRAGTLVIPRVRIPYFDPKTGRFAAAASEEARVVVRAREGDGAAGATPEPGASAPAAAPPGAAPTAEAVEPSRGRLAWLLFGMGGMGAGGIAVMAARRWRRGRRARAAFDAALAAVAEDDAGAEAAALARALRDALARRVPETNALAAEEIVALPALAPAVGAAARLLLAVERARFDPTAPLPSRRAVRLVVASL